MTTSHTRKHTMKLKLTSMLVAIIVSPSVFSEVNIYTDERNSMSVGGFIDVRVINTQNQTEVVNGTSRINFKRVYGFNG